MTSHKGLLDETLKRLEKYFGQVEFVGRWHEFTFTDFYEPEMGANLSRCLVAFEGAKPTRLLPKTKKWTAKVENKFRKNGKRLVNIDAGYVDFCKLVLASGKSGGHKIAVTDEVYADMILDFRKGVWHPFEWCFPDFASGIYFEELTKIRALLKEDSSAKR